MLLTFGPRKSLLWETVLYIVGCLAACLEHHHPVITSQSVSTLCQMSPEGCISAGWELLLWNNRGKVKASFKIAFYFYTDGHLQCTLTNANLKSQVQGRQCMIVCMCAYVDAHACSHLSLFCCEKWLDLPSTGSLAGAEKKFPILC